MSIHDRMLAILKLAGYERWVGTEPDPRDLLIPFPSEPMTIWPISRRVNSRSIVRGLLGERSNAGRIPYEYFTVTLTDVRSQCPLLFLNEDVCEM